MSERFAESELVGDDLVLLLDLTYAGRTWRISTETVDVADGADWLPYSAGMSPPQIPAAVAGFSIAPESRTVSLELWLPDNANVPQLVADGHDLSAAFGELSYWRRGTDYSKRVRLFAGRASSPIYGAKNEPIRLSLVSMPLEDRSAILDGAEVVEVWTWPASLTAHRGSAYPRVFGWTNVGFTDVYPNTPGWVVDVLNRYLLIAGTEVVTSSVAVKDLAAGTGWATLSTTTRKDAYGVPVTTVTLPTTGDAAYSAEGRYVVNWAISTGAMYNRDRTGPIQTAGELLEWALNRSTMTIDKGRTAAAIDRLRGYRLDGFIDGLGVSSWEWIRANLLPILPISIQYGPDGLYPVVYDWQARPEDAHASLDAQRGDVSRVRDAGVEYRNTRGGQLANEIRVQYGHDIDKGAPTRTCIVHGDAGQEAATDRYLNRACHVSRMRHDTDRPYVYTVSSTLIYRPATAGVVGNWLAASKALASRRVQYDGPHTLAWVQPGHVLIVTDTDIAFASQLCMVVEVQLSSKRVRLTLETLDATTV